MRNFKVELLAKQELRKSLTMKSASNMCQLMDHMDKYKRVEEDQVQGKGKAKIFIKKRDPWGGGYQGNRSQREFSNQTSPSRTQLVNSLFKEPVYHILEKIKNDSYFKWPNKMGRDPSRRNQSFYFHYHKD